MAASLMSVNRRTFVELRLRELRLRDLRVLRGNPIADNSRVTRRDAVECRFQVDASLFCHEDLFTTKHGSRRSDSYPSILETIWMLVNQSLPQLT